MIVNLGYCSFRSTLSCFQHYALRVRFPGHVAFAAGASSARLRSNEAKGGNPEESALSLTNIFGLPRTADPRARPLPRDAETFQICSTRIRPPVLNLD